MERDLSGTVAHSHDLDDDEIDHEGVRYEGAVPDTVHAGGLLVRDLLWECHWLCGVSVQE